MKYKVIFFDSWKGGAHNYARHLDTMAAADIDAFLLHLGSWGNEEHYEKEEYVGKLKARDISYYNGAGFEEIIKRENPDLVLFLSIHTFAHRAFNRYCQKRNIPTILMYHGLIRVQDVDDNSKGSYKVNFLLYGMFILKRLPKIFWHTLPCYIESIMRTKGGLDDYLAFFQNIIDVFVKPSTFKVAKDSQTNRCLIYAGPDRIHARNIYGLKDEDIIEVGNPDLSAFGVKYGDIGCRFTANANESDEVFYLDTALTAVGLIFKSEQEYLKFLSETNKVLMSKGKRLVLKPHPDTRKNYKAEDFEKAGIEVVANADMIGRMRNAYAVLAEPTSLAIVPALMGLPLCLVSYDKASDLRYGQVLTSYPKSIMLTDINNMVDDITRKNNEDSQVSTQEWIQFNAGPMPSEDMPKRVVSVMLDLIGSR